MPYGRTYSSHAFTGSLTTLFLHQLGECRLSAGEVCLCLTDTAWNPAYGAACQAAATALGAEAFQVVLAWDRPVPERALAAMCEAADLIVYMTAFPLHYRPEIGRALERGARVLCCMQPPQTLERLRADPDVRRRALAGAARLERGEIIRITSAAGTDLTMNRGARPVLAHYGVADEPGHLDFWGLGSVECAPLEEATEGTLVLDAGDCCFHLGRFVEAPVRIAVERGRIVALEGGLDARLIREELEAAGDEEAFRLGHMAWGVDHRARWLQPVYQTPDMGGGGADTESFLGVVQVELGSNDDVSFRGLNRSRAHLGLCLRRASLEIDGNVVIAEGRFADPALV